MVKTLVKHGNSLALVIDKPILDLLKIDAETQLEIVTDGKSLMVSPTNGATRDKFEQAMNDTVERYGKMLKRLAE